MSLTTTTAAQPGAASRIYRRAVHTVPMPLRRGVRYYRTFGRWPATRRPRSFTEKIAWRIAYDRREVLADTCDKARMKERVRRSAPSWVRIPALRWQGTDLAELAGVDLPQQWVLKPNHRSQLVRFGAGRPDIEELRRTTAGWLQPVEWTEGGEWAYSRADASLIVEDRIDAPGGGLGCQVGAGLTDYKFYVFDGTVTLVQTDVDRFGEHASRLYSPEWRCLGGTRFFPAGRDVPRPALLEPMLEAAAAIGAEFDFMRVDLYEHDGQVWFGELTPYPGSGLVAWDPPEVDLQTGACWRLPQR